MQFRTEMKVNWRSEAVLKQSVAFGFWLRSQILSVPLSNRWMLSNDCILFIPCSFLIHIDFGFPPTGAQLLPAHLWSLIGRLILPSVSSAACGKHQTDCWWNATELQNTNNTTMWLCSQMSLAEHRLSDKWSIICLSNMNCERWKPSPHCVETATSHRALLGAMSLAQGWEVSAIPRLRRQSFTVY